MKFKIVIDMEKCKGCGLCAHFCDKECLEISQDINTRGSHFAVVRQEKDGVCRGCLRCALICPDAVIEIEKIED